MQFMLEFYANIIAGQSDTANRDGDKGGKCRVFHSYSPRLFTFSYSGYWKYTANQDFKFFMGDETHLLLIAVKYLLWYIFLAKEDGGGRRPM